MTMHPILEEHKSIHCKVWIADQISFPRHTRHGNDLEDLMHLIIMCSVCDACWESYRSMGFNAGKGHPRLHIQSSLFQHCYRRGYKDCHLRCHEGCNVSSWLELSQVDWSRRKRVQKYNTGTTQTHTYKCNVDVN